MNFDISLRACLFVLAVLVMLVSCTLSEESKIEKREAESDSAVEETLTDDEVADADKRRLFRYGRGALMRYGRGAIMRYGKRGGLLRYGKRGGTLFRYGKRDDDVYELPEELSDSSKRLFRWGKRDGDEGDYSRLFRWGKRDDDDSFDAEEKRRLFRYGKREDEDYEPIVDVDDLEEADKRQMQRGLFRYGKRDDDMESLLEEAKRRIFRYGRETRDPQEPHVPFRFGDEDKE